jgi:hypothetical protein
MGKLEEGIKTEHFKWMLEREYREEADIIERGRLL